MLGKTIQELREPGKRFICGSLDRPSALYVFQPRNCRTATRAASGIPDFDELLDKARSKAPTRSLVSIDDVGMAQPSLPMTERRLITGETFDVDSGYHIMD